MSNPDKMSGMMNTFNEERNLFSKISLDLKVSVKGVCARTRLLFGPVNFVQNNVKSISVYFVKYKSHLDE